jgi:hypothetical protein
MNPHAPSAKRGRRCIFHDEPQPIRSA